MAPMGLSMESRGQPGRYSGWTPGPARSPHLGDHSTGSSSGSEASAQRVKSTVSRQTLIPCWSSPLENAPVPRQSGTGSWREIGSTTVGLPIVPSVRASSSASRLAGKPVGPVALRLPHPEPWPALLSVSHPLPPAMRYQRHHPSVYSILFCLLCRPLSNIHGPKQNMCGRFFLGWVTSDVPPHLQER